MKALIDGDILRYEVGFGAETGWRAITGEENAIPPWDYVEQALVERIASILHTTQADSYELHLTEGRTFRDAIAITKPYKGHRIVNKPWHFDNLTAYMVGALPTVVSRGIEADDQMAMASNGIDTIVCSRDKDLRQVPGLFYSWELGRQPGFGPVLIDPIGSLELTYAKDGKAILKGTGYAWFCGQLLVGDRVDNIPGLAGVGPVNAYELLSGCKTPEQYAHIVAEEYKNDKLLLEQGQLLWIVRRLNPDGTPEMWRRDLYA